MQKCHSIIVTGKVQDIGFRSVVEHIGRSFGIPGLVFNAKDGSVRILCCGNDSVIDNFTQAIRVRGEESGTEIANIKEKTLSINIDLPDDFSKVSSDDEIDIGRKLDKANLLLKTGFENLNTDLNTGFNQLNTDLNRGFSTLTTIMSEHNTRMDEHNIRLEAMVSGINEHNKHLEAILEKLANK
ncbi:MAG: acylphosphatase [Candidatus Methanoperedens sp.]|nr:acylphosphatase [Candidatus Methanoperedens sp.]